MATEFSAEGDLFVFEAEGVAILSFRNLVKQKSLSDLEELLSNDRQYFNSNSVELIQTSPRTSLRKSIEQSPH